MNRYKYIINDYQEEIGYRFLLWQFIPLMRFIDRKMFNKRKIIFNELIDIFKNKYLNHYKDYNESVIRDICDALIYAKNEALAKGKGVAPYLTDNNLAMVVLDLFLGILMYINLKYIHSFS